MAKVDVIGGDRHRDVVVSLRAVAPSPLAPGVATGATVEVVGGPQHKDVIVAVPQPMQPSTAPAPNIGLVEISSIDTVIIGPPGPQGPPGQNGVDGVDGAPGTTFIGDNAPPTPLIGQLWWESDLGQLLIWYDDGNSRQWVAANSPGPQGPPGPVGPPATSSAAFIGPDPPDSPAIGTLWWESDSGQMFIWYQDINSSQWVPTSIGVPGQSASELMEKMSALEARIAALEATP